MWMPHYPALDLPRAVWEGAPAMPRFSVCAPREPQLRRTALKEFGQLFALSSGAAAVYGDFGYALFPAHRMGWLPPAVPRQLLLRGAAEGAVLCVDPCLCRNLPHLPAVFTGNLMATALLERLAAHPSGLALEEAGERRLQLLMEELLSCQSIPLRLPMPETAPAARIARRLLLYPSEVRSEAEWAQWAGISRRSLVRYFAQTGVGFRQWRIRRRAMSAIEHLARGSSVGEAAAECGYGSATAFIVAFRRLLGCTPGEFLRKP
jgi:AraC-like DNA-binding protein